MRRVIKSRCVTDRKRRSWVLFWKLTSARVTGFKKGQLSTWLHKSFNIWVRLAMSTKPDGDVVEGNGSGRLLFRDACADPFHLPWSLLSLSSVNTNREMILKIYLTQKISWFIKLNNFLNRVKRTDRLHTLPSIVSLALAETLRGCKLQHRNLKFYFSFF